MGIWWYSRSRRPEVDLASFDDPYFTDLVAHYRALGFRVWVLDVTTDMAIPAFVALARDAMSDRWSIGLGCHTSAKLGVQRALTELNQLFDPRATRRAPWGDPMPDEAFLLPDEEKGALRREDYEEARSPDLRADVEHAVGRAAALGMETVVVDQTRPDVGLSVVKVTVPGLRHIWPRLGSGRLMDVPVRLGWRAEPLDEEHMNPRPLYL